MSLTNKNTASNYYLKETSPGSEQYRLCYKDAATHFRNLTYGFFLDTPDDFPEHFLEVIKPRLTYSNFDYGKALTVRRAIGAAAWMALPFDDKTFLDQFQLVKVGAAHIQLQPLA